MELSLCMIVKNEEENLPRCLNCVGRAMDEIIIVDTGSSDATKEIALRYTDKVFDFAWRDDFSAARNEAFAHAEKPFVMWLDADDTMDEENAERLIALKDTLTADVDAVMMPYHCGIREDGTPSLVFERERIIRRDSGLRFSGFVHEAIALRGNVVHADIPVRHMGGRGKKNPRRNLELYEKHMANGYDMTPRDRYYYARELMDCGETARAEKAFSAFLDADGWLPNRIDAHIRRGQCLQKLNRLMEARAEYLSAMAYGAPGPDALCAMGGSMMEAGDFAAAAFWYRAAMTAEQDAAGGAFIAPDLRTYVPAMQLCVCYERLGLKEAAREMNELALAYRPGDAAALQNRRYFSELG